MLRYVSAALLVFLVGCSEEPTSSSEPYVDSLLLSDSLESSDSSQSSGPTDALSPEVSDEPALLCESTQDGECDEPVNCPLGSDEVDCVEACAQGEMLWLYGAACAYRAPPTEPTHPQAQLKGQINTTGTHDRSIMVPLGDGSGQRARHYRLFVPPRYDPDKAWPLVIMMPGHRVDLYSLAEYTHLEASAEAHGFLLVYAEQEWRSDAFKWAWWTDWSWSTKPDSNPDVAFLRGLVDALSEGWSVDTSRVYGVGHSRGGAMAYISAFELSDVFAALCSQSGFIEFGFDTHVQGYQGRKTPMMLVHGTVDTDVPVARSDAMHSQMQALGWGDSELVYYRLGNVAHRWQPWMNEALWTWLSQQSLEGGSL